MSIEKIKEHLHKVFEILGELNPETVGELPENLFERDFGQIKFQLEEASNQADILKRKRVKSKLYSTLVVEVDQILEILLLFYQKIKSNPPEAPNSGELLVRSCMEAGYEVHGRLGLLRDVSSERVGGSINAFLLYLRGG